MHLEMSLEEAALLTQKVWRGFANRARKDQLNLNAKLHLGYELHVLELRKKRKGLFIGFLQHMAYMARTFRQAPAPPAPPSRQAACPPPRS